MGVDILWLMPINPISQKLRKGTLGSYYAVSDYLAVNPEYGTLDDFKHLVAEAHRQGFKVILDWVANHTGWDNVWVTQHPDWYKRNAKGELEAYHYTDLSDHHEETWADVIGLDYSRKDLREGMIAALSYWVKTADIDGYRCDVAWAVPVDFWEAARARLEAIKPVFMLAEADTANLHARAFDMTYDWSLYHLLVKVAHGQADASDLAKLYTQPARRYPAGAYRMTFTSDHDENSWNGTDRELYGDGAEAMAVLAATLPGMPLVYSGQEAALDKRLAFFDKDPIDWKTYARTAFYTRILAFKHAHPALWNGTAGGDLEILATGDPKVFAFDRIKGGSRVRVVVNLSASPRDVALPGDAHTRLEGWGWSVQPIGARGAGLASGSGAAGR